MTARVGYGLSALVLGLGALVGVQYSSATFTDDSSTPAQVTAARDWTPPTVSVNDPGFVIYGVVSIMATADDADTEVDTVEIQYRQQGDSTWMSLCVDTDSPWDCSWDTDTVTDGTYELRAIATDIDANTETSETIITEVYNTAGVVIDPVPSPVSGTIRLTAAMVNVRSGPTTITFQAATTGSGSYIDLPGCTNLTGPNAFCDFDTTLGVSGTTYDLRAVGRRYSATYYDVQTDILVDNTAPTVTIDKAADQADPTTTSPINFTVVFNEPVTGFEDADVTLGGTSAGPTTATVTGSGTTYNVAVSGMTSNGTVLATVPTGGATDAAGNGNTTSTSSDNSVIYDGLPTTVTIDEAAGQPDPTNGNTINFTVVFDRSVTGFTGTDVTLGGTVTGTRTRTVTGGGTTYNVAITNMTGSGTVIATIAAGVATDTYGGGNEASTSTDNTVTRDLVAPTVTINKAATQADPTNGSPINFTVVFSEPVNGFETGDVTVTGSAGGTKVATVTGSGSTYDVAVTGMTGNNVTVVASVAAGKATDLAGNANTASTSTDNSVLRDTALPTVTVARATGQTTPSSVSPINFRVTFNEPVTDFDDGDLTIAGTSGGTKITTVTGGPSVYNVAVTGMVGDGTVIASVAASVATDLAGNNNTASGGTAGGRTVTYDDLAPTVTINQAAGQADPTNGSTINFTVVFSEAVTGFATGDVTIGGTATGTKTATVTGSGTTYDVAVTGMTSSGTVIATVASGRAVDAASQGNTASTSTDNTVTRDVTAPTATINRAGGQADPGSGTQVNFTVTFSETVTGFVNTDITISGTAGGTKVVTVTGSGTTYNVRVTGMTTAGTVVMNFGSGSASDAAGNDNVAPTIIDNSVIWAP